MAEVSVLQRINPSDPSGPLLPAGGGSPQNWINNQPPVASDFTRAGGATSYTNFAPDTPGAFGRPSTGVFGPGGQFGSGGQLTNAAGSSPFTKPGSDWSNNPDNTKKLMGDDFTKKFNGENGYQGQQNQQGDDKPAEEKAQPDDEKDVTDHHRKRAGKDKDKKLRRAPKAFNRPKNKNKLHPMKHLGVKDLDQEGGCGGDNSDPSSMPDDIVPILGGIARNMATQIPAMEQMLQNLPNAVLGNFLNNLPPGLQSFIPSNVIPGLSNTGPFNINGLVSLFGGSALSNISSDALRSILPGIGIPQQAIQQLSSIPLTQIIPQLNQVLPQVNQLAYGINSIGNVAMNAASVANVLSTIQLNIGNGINNGIPVNPALLNQAVNVALSSTGLGQIIPTNIMGLASSFTQNPLGTLVNAAMSSGMLPSIPILPSNLSNNSAQLLSGLSQFLPPEIAQNLMNISQLTNMLPQNLQNLLPAISPVLQGQAPNFIQELLNAAPNKVPNSDQPNGNKGGGGGCKIKEAPNDGKTSKDVYDINLAQPLSPIFDLFQLTSGAAISPGSHRIHKGESGPDVDEVIKNLSELSVNVLEPLREAFPLMQINSGYRESGKHAKGKSVDVAWNVTPTKLMEIADWARQNLPVTVQMNQFKTNWLHLEYSGSCSNSGAASTAGSGGCEQGLVNRKG